MRFGDSEFLVMSNRLMSTVVALCALLVSAVISRWSPSRETYTELDSKTGADGGSHVRVPYYLFSLCSIGNIVSSWCQYESLKYVDFSVQVSSLCLQLLYSYLNLYVHVQILFKSSKLLPVMIMSVLVSRKKYKIRDYLIAFAVCCGLVVFTIGDEEVKAASSPTPASNETNSTSDASLEKDASHGQLWYLINGLILLLMYVGFDAFTSNWQERMSREYDVNFLQMMFLVNVYSTILSLASLVYQSQLVSSMTTILSIPQLSIDVALLGLSSALSNAPIYLTVTRFGAVALACVMIARQLFSVITSFIVFQHLVNLKEVIGVIVAFSGLIAHVYYKYKAHRAPLPG